MREAGAIRPVRIQVSWEPNLTPENLAHRSIPDLLFRLVVGKMMKQQPGRQLSTLFRCM
jgi:hypothetical protein